MWTYGQRRPRQREITLQVGPPPVEIIIKKICFCCGEFIQDLRGTSFMMRFYNVESIGFIAQLQSGFENMTDGTSIGPVTVDSTHGAFRVEGIQRINENLPIRVVLTEVNTPGSFVSLAGEVSFTIDFEDGVAILPPVVAVANEDDRELISYRRRGETAGNDDQTIELRVANRRGTGLVLLKQCQVTGEPLPGAVFELTLTGVESFENMSEFGLSSIPISGQLFNATTGPDGKIHLNGIVTMPGTTQFRIDLTEITPPTGYSALGEARFAELLVENGVITLVDSDFDTCDLIDTEGDGTGVLRVIVDNTPNPSLELLKTDTAGSPLDGATFSFTFTNIQGLTTTTRSSGSDGPGRIRFPNLQLIDLSQPVEITISEISPPSGFDGMDQDILITARLVNGEWQIVSSDFDTSLVSVIPRGPILEIIARNEDEPPPPEPPPEGYGTLTIQKYSLVNGTPLNGVDFEITIVGPNVNIGPTILRTGVGGDPGELIIGGIPNQIIMEEDYFFTYSWDDGGPPPFQRAPIQRRHANGQLPPGWDRSLPDGRGMPGEFRHQSTQGGYGFWREPLYAQPPTENIIITIREHSPAFGYKQMIGDIIIELEPVMVIDSTIISNNFISTCNPRQPGPPRFNCCWNRNPPCTFSHMSSCGDDCSGCTPVYVHPNANCCWFYVGGPASGNVRTGRCRFAQYTGTEISTMYRWVLGPMNNVDGAGMAPGPVSELGEVTGLISPGGSGRDFGSIGGNVANRPGVDPLLSPQTICEDEFIPQFHEGERIPQGETGVLFTAGDTIGRGAGPSANSTVTVDGGGRNDHSQCWTHTCTAVCLFHICNWMCWQAGECLFQGCTGLPLNTQHCPATCRWVTVDQNVNSDTQWRQRPTFEPFNIDVAINNIPIMDITGEVWLDLPARISDKITGTPRGRLTDPRVEGIRVRLYYAPGTQNPSPGCECLVCVRRNADIGNEYLTSGNAYYPLPAGRPESFSAPRYTNSSGIYRFNRLRADLEYVIEFEYDGVNYYVVMTGSGTDTQASHAEEDSGERDSFNNGFTEIDGTGGSVLAPNNGMTLEFIDVPTGTGLEYRGINDRQGVPDVSRLRTMVNGLPVRQGNTPVVMSTVLDGYEMHAETEPFGNLGGSPPSDRLAIRNAGLRVRETDIALRMRLYDARLTINDEIQEFEYCDETGTIYTLGNSPSSDIEIARLSLYNSDFHFRLTDYFTLGIGNQFEMPWEYTLEGIPSMEDVLYRNREELRAFVTYKVYVNNQGGEYKGNLIQADQIRIYYDYFYEFRHTTTLFNGLGQEIGTANATNIPLEVVSVGGRDYRVLTVELDGDIQLRDGGQKYFFVEFEVRRECGTSSVSSPHEDIGNTGLPIRRGIFHNVAEVTMYTTTLGMVDRDSSVGNARGGDVGNSPGTDRWRIEDNVDRARGVEIELHDNPVREITGTVWESYRPIGTEGFTHGTGDRTNHDPLVDDVVVQLIELFTIEGFEHIGWFEYIWKETVTGSNRVASTASWSIEPSTREEGRYTFMNFIPGHYIVRFIYGDGSIRVTNLHTEMDMDSVRFYNGQDFQSTIRGEDTQNTALDNEARRLQVMAHSIEIYRELGIELEARSNLDATWMCADTYRFHIPVEPVNNDGHYNNVEIDHEIIYEDGVVFPDQRRTSGLFDIQNFDFGLVRRPDTRLDLVKYLDSVLITSHVGDTIFCTATGYNSENWRRTPNPLELPLRRRERGVWHFYTDVNQLLAGANLEAVYRYEVLNVGEVDLLDESLVIIYEENPIEEYIAHLVEQAPIIKRDIQLGSRGRYVDPNYEWLGQAYWTGIWGPFDAVVSTRAEVLAESTNNLLAFDTATQFAPGIDFMINPDYTERAADRWIIVPTAEIYEHEYINQVVETIRPTAALIPNHANRSLDDTILLTLSTTEMRKR